MKHSNWLKLITRLLASNQSALFKHGLLYTTLKLFMTTTPGLIKIKLGRKLFLMSQNIEDKKLLTNNSNE